jgi:hypothetical protein
VLANVKNSLLATHRAVAAKHLPRYLGAFAWRFNRRFVLKAIYERLAIAVNAREKMRRRVGVKMHHGASSQGHIERHVSI